jgi:23S rRNA (cytidine1920-2'-O)/16S rRNA (cytidine1409-2'-O)-methyltransferase
MGGRLVPLRQALERLRPDLEAPEDEIEAGHVLVNGVPSTNPNTLVGPDTPITVRPPAELRGLVKLRAALAGFDVPVEGRVALDAGAAAGGFVQALLESGAARVYAVEVGYGQLLGSLRQDERVVNLEQTNVGRLSTELVPEPIEVVSLDLGFLALATGVSQLGAIDLAPDADLVALVKPMSELRLSEPPTDPARLREARDRATAGIAAAGWRVVASMDSPIRGAHGAFEMFIHATRRAA